MVFTGDLAGKQGPVGGASLTPAPYLHAGIVSLQGSGPFPEAPRWGL